MGRFRLLGTTADEVLRAGIAFHHQTDDAFHGHRWFTTKQSALYQCLRERDLARGPARAVAHVGPELLLDGALAQLDPGPRDLMLDQLGDMEHSLEVGLVSLVEPVRRQEFREHLKRIDAVGLPTDYHDPAAVGIRLQRILSARPRLSFDAEQLGAVTEELHLAKLEIDVAPQALVEELAASLSRC